MCPICWDEAVVNKIFEKIKATPFGQSYSAFASIRQRANASTILEMLVDAHIILEKEFEDHHIYIGQIFQLLHLITVPLGMADGHHRSGNSNGKLTNVAPLQSKRIYQLLKLLNVEIIFFGAIPPHTFQHSSW